MSADKVATTLLSFSLSQPLFVTSRQTVSFRPSSEDPLFRRVTGHFLSCTLNVLQDVQPACITSAPWSYTSEEAQDLQPLQSPIASLKQPDGKRLKHITSCCIELHVCRTLQSCMWKRLSEPFLGWEPDKALLGEEAADLCRCKTFTKRTNIFGQLKAMMVARADTSDTMRTVKVV